MSHYATDSIAMLSPFFYNLIIITQNFIREKGARDQNDIKKLKKALIKNIMISSALIPAHGERKDQVLVQQSD